MGEESSQGITRRDLLRRGAVLGGAVVWTTPVVQTLGMGRAFANTASPVETRISFIAMNVNCGGDTYFVKWNREGGWEDTPGNTNPNCQVPGATGTPMNGGDLGIGTPQITGDCAVIDMGGSGCTLVGTGKVFGAQRCCDFSDVSNICLDC